MDLPIVQSSRFACDPTSLCAPEVSRNWAFGEMGEMFQFSKICVPKFQLSNEKDPSYVGTLNKKHYQDLVLNNQYNGK